VTLNVDMKLAEKDTTCTVVCITVSTLPRRFYPARTLSCKTKEC